MIICWGFRLCIHDFTGRTSSSSSHNSRTWIFQIRLWIAGCSAQWFLQSSWSEELSIPFIEQGSPPGAYTSQWHQIRCFAGANNKSEVGAGRIEFAMPSYIYIYSVVMACDGSRQMRRTWMCIYIYIDVVYGIQRLQYHMSSCAGETNLL